MPITLKEFVFSNAEDQMQVSAWSTWSSFVSMAA
jgi:hypothetical protein